MGARVVVQSQHSGRKSNNVSGSGTTRADLHRFVHRSPFGLRPSRRLTSPLNPSNDNEETGSSTQRPVRVVLVGPSLDIIGGQAVILQRLLKRFEAVPEIDASFLPVNPRLPGPLRSLQKIKYVRTVVTSIAYGISLLTRLWRYDVAHVFSASYASFVLAPTPALVMARIFDKRTILNYRSGEAQDHFRRWGSAAPTARLASRIVVPSGYLVDILEEFRLEAEFIYNSVDLASYTFRERGPCRPVFLANRNFAPLYNVACVLRAFRIIQTEHPEARLIVAGDGQQRDLLHALARDLDLQNVDWVGQVDPSRMVELYDEVDVYLNSSSIDNMPNSIVEAYASGLPVVTTDAGGIPYIVDDEKTGLLAPVDDHEQLARAALRVLEDEELARTLSRGGRARCEEHFTWDSVTTQWVALYQELAGR